MERSLDYKGRWRNHTVAFRVSDEEAKLLNDLVALSGLTKQEYIIRRLTCRDVVVQGNPRVYKALKNQMAAIHEELKRLETVSPDNDELLYRSSLRFGRCRADVPRTSCTPAGRKGTFDGRYGCRKCFCVTFDKSNKTAVSGADFL